MHTIILARETLWLTEEKTPGVFLSGQGNLPRQWGLVSQTEKARKLSVRTGTGRVTRASEPEPLTRVLR